MATTAPGELYDPLIHGETVGERIGSTDFIPAKAFASTRTRATSGTSCRRRSATASSRWRSKAYAGLPRRQDQTVRDAGRPGRLHHQPVPGRHPVPRPAGFPPNSITFRVLYGDDPCCKYEPDTDTRFRSVVALGPSTPYFWKFTWGTGTEVRVSVKEDGITGENDLQRRRADAERRLCAQPAATPTWGRRRAEAELNPHRCQARSIGTSGSATILARHRSAAPCAADCEARAMARARRPA